MKALLADLERKHPTLRQTMLAALGNVNPSHLYDRKLRDAKRDDDGAASDAELIPRRALRRV
jgi:tRNA 2-thiocytidine biosynthesis protein TtcA